MNKAKPCLFKTIYRDGGYALARCFWCNRLVVLTPTGSIPVEAVFAIGDFKDVRD